MPKIPAFHSKLVGGLPPFRRGQELFQRLDAWLVKADETLTMRGGFHMVGEPGSRAVPVTKTRPDRIGKGGNPFQVWLLNLAYINKGLLSTNLDIR